MNKNGIYLVMNGASRAIVVADSSVSAWRRISSRVGELSPESMWDSTDIDDKQVTLLGQAADIFTDGQIIMMDLILREIKE